MSKAGKLAKQLRRERSIRQFDPSPRKEGKRKNFGQSDKLGRMQMNWSTAQSGIAKAEHRFYHANFIEGQKRESFIG